jgi:hypothetical protein
LSILQLQGQPAHGSCMLRLQGLQGGSRLLLLLLSQHHLLRLSSLGRHLSGLRLLLLQGGRKVCCQPRQLSPMLLQQLLPLSLPASLCLRLLRCGLCQLFGCLLCCQLLLVLALVHHLSQAAAVLRCCGLSCAGMPRLTL